MTFTAYEYKEVSVDIIMASQYLDGYENFGWEPDERFHTEKTSGKVTLHLKRDRKILNKTELTRLQRHFEACMEEICSLENSKHSRATMAAITTGIIGTAFMAGSVFAVTARPPIIWLTVLLAIPGFALWGGGYFVCQAVKRKRTETVTPLIEKKYDEAYEVCEKGNKLLTGIS